MTVVNIKKQKAQKNVVIKRKFKFENYKNSLEAIQLDNNNKKININSIKKIIKN